MNCRLFSFFKNNEQKNNENQILLKSVDTGEGFALTRPFLDGQRHSEGPYTADDIISLQYQLSLYSMRALVLNECCKRNLVDAEFLKFLSDELARTIMRETHYFREYICIGNMGNVTKNFIQEGFAFETSCPVYYFIAANTPGLVEQWDRNHCGERYTTDLVDRAYKKFFNAHVQYVGPFHLDPEDQGKEPGQFFTNQYPSLNGYYEIIQQLCYEGDTKVPFSFGEMVQCYTLVLEQMRNYIINRIETGGKDNLLSNDKLLKKFHLCRTILTHKFIIPEYNEPSTLFTKKLRVGDVDWTKNNLEKIVENITAMCDLESIFGLPLNEVNGRVHQEDFDNRNPSMDFRTTDDDAAAVGMKARDEQRRRNNKEENERQENLRNGGFGAPTQQRAADCHPPIIPNGLDIPYSIQEAPAFNIPQK